MATIGDVVLIYRNELPGFFARIQDISPDPKRDWYQVTLLVLQMPLTEVVWILREEYINGEGFTMNGERVRIEKVTGGGGLPREGLLSDSDSTGQDTSRDDKVIPMFDRKRR
jgi:hypothetical protein